MTAGPRDARALYLSFDDGPDPEHTPPILDLLAANGSHATFFLLGEKVEQFPDIVRRMVAEGHRIGNHSYNHPRFAEISQAEVVAQIERTDQVLLAFDVQRRHRFRPPSGALPMSLLAYCTRARRRITYWTYDSMDYRRESTPQLVERLRTIPPVAGDIVLMHDEDDAIVSALRVLVPEWRAAGFSLDALPAETT
jgi:peptidoglycan/xylan/chitin deacetylase (PgdA/CDA1 family)